MGGKSLLPGIEKQTLQDDSSNRTELSSLAVPDLLTGSHAHTPPPVRLGSMQELSAERSSLTAEVFGVLKTCLRPR